MSSHIRLLRGLDVLLETMEVPDFPEHQKKIENTLRIFDKQGNHQKRLRWHEVMACYNNKFITLKDSATETITIGEETMELGSFITAFLWAVPVQCKALAGFSVYLKQTRRVSSKNETVLKSHINSFLLAIHQLLTI